MEKEQKKGIFIEIKEDYSVSLQINGNSTELAAAIVAGMEDSESNLAKLIKMSVEIYDDRQKRKEAGELK